MNIQNYVGGLRRRLLACSATNSALVVASGGRLSESWISKFRAGHLTNPRVETMIALVQALDSCEHPAETRTAA
jgi:hypothetical protein